MSLAWNTGSSTLAQWGFSAGDIAAIAGAGRSVGTWLMAQAKDRNLLDFLQIETTDLITRKGLVDRFALHERWDTRLVLLQNGRRRIIQPAGGKVVENMDSFTWLMTLFVASLDAAFSLTNLRKVMAELLTMLFSEQAHGLDYLLHELPRHVEGWMSIATTRNIAARARQEWKNLADRGVHEAGLIPTGDVGEVARLLHWIAASREQKFETSSGDSYALSIVIRTIGIDLLSTDSTGGEQDENCLVVRLTTNPIPAGSTKRFWQLSERKGMRVPLQCMEECVSLWPGTAAENNERRRVFEDGMSAAKGLRLTPGRPLWENGEAPVLFYRVENTEKSTQTGRVDNIVHRLADEFFPTTTTRVVAGLHSIAQDLKAAGLVEGLGGDTNHILQHFNSNPPILAHLQAFLMGYYYTLLAPLLDTTQMSIRQAFGSWGWYDLDMIFKVSNILSETSVKNKAGHFYKHGIMRLLALFFAGVEETQLSLIVAGVVGIHGKLSLLTSSLFGDIDTWEKAGTFVLIDTDPTCIPSTSRGIVTSSPTWVGFGKMVSDSKKIETLDIKDVNLRGTGIDFTSHIEPDWDHDVQMSTVVFRYQGRFIRRINPVDCEYAILEDSPVRIGKREINTGTATEVIKGLSHESLDRVRVPESHDWTTGFIPGPDPRNTEFDQYKPAMLICTQGRSKARTCLRAWYWRYRFHAVPSITPYSCMPLLEGCQVLCANDDGEYDLKSGWVREGSLQSNDLLRAVGRPPNLPHVKACVTLQDLNPYVFIPPPQSMSSCQKSCYGSTNIIYYYYH